MGRQFKGKQLSDNLSLSGSFSGSFQGDGSKLTGVGAGGSSDVWYNGGTYATSSKNLIVTGSISVTPGTINYLTASYAISASHEIIKEVSSSFADTASYVNTLQQDVIITGSLNIVEAIEPIKITNGSNTMYMQVNNIAQLNSSRALRLKAQGDAFGTGVILESDTSNIEIKASTAGKKIFIHSPTIEITGSLTVTGSLNMQGSSNYESGSITLDRTTVPSLPGSDDKINIGTGGSGAPYKAFQIYTNGGFVVIGPQNDTYSHFTTDRSKFYFNKPLQVSGEVMSHNEEDLVLGNNGGTSDTITIAQNDIIFELNNQNIFHMTTGSVGGILSGSADSTASFGTYIGDGSQLLGLDPFPFIGDAEITGSLTVTSSLNIQGPSNFESGSMTFDVTTDPISPGSNTKVNIGAGSSTSVRALKIHTNAGYLEIGPQNAGYSHFYTDRANFYFNKPIHVNGAVYGYGGDLILGRNSGTEDTITLADEKVTIKLNDTDIFVISSSHEFSGSAASTASFGTYIGDGSQLTNVTGEWDGSHDGNASISGSLTLTGSLLNTGTVSINDTDSPYTLTGTQQFVLIDPSGGNVTINMPTAATYPGRQIFFKLTQNVGPHIVTLQRQGSDTIDGDTTYTGLDFQYEAISVVSNGETGWFIF